MNGKEKDVLGIIANDIKWMKQKQGEHDKRFNKLDTRLEKGDTSFMKKSLAYKISGFFLSVISGLTWLVLRLHKII